MTLDDIIKAHNCCHRIHNLSCTECPFYKIKKTDMNCEEILVELTIQTLISMRNLLDDKVNHHYYDMLEFYQEENARLRNNLDEIKAFVDEHID